jgi:hypothetical protein
MPAKLQEGDYPFPQEASLRGTRGEASATIAMWSVPVRRSKHEFKSAFSTHTHSNKLSINNKLETLGREADCSRGLKELDANEPPDATIKYAWVTP